MKSKRTNPDFLNGVPELLILSLLSRRPMYGYELVQAIRQSTAGTLEFGEGCVYPILHRLEAEGLLGGKRETSAAEAAWSIASWPKARNALPTRQPLGGESSRRSIEPSAEANMANQPWLDRMRRQLVENDLPPAYIRRFMEELSDHYEDITEENMSTENDVSSRLGEPDQLAEAAIYRLSPAGLSLAGIRRRHSSSSALRRCRRCWSVCPGLSPACTASSCCLRVARADFNLNVKRFDPAASAVLPYVFSLMMVVIPCLPCQSLLLQTDQRLGISKRWIILSSIVLAVVAITPIWTVTLSDQPGQSVLRCGIAYPQDIGGVMLMYFSSFRQLLQFFAPLLIGVWFLRQTRKRDHNEESLRLAA